MKIFVTGGTGFVGTFLVNALLRSGHEVTCVGRSPKMKIAHENLHYVRGDATQRGTWQEAVGKANAVVNLAGVSIFKRWNEDYKKMLYDSRILTTRNLVEALPENGDTVLVSTSAVGFYGHRGEDILLESEPVGTGFLSVLSGDWEKEAALAEKKGVRVAVTRFGIVLGKGGGALATMVPLFKWFLGGPLGTGRQWFPWIHIDDLVAAIHFIISRESIRGPLNFTAPIPIRQKDFAKTLARQLGRPSILPAPSFMIRLVMGELGDALLSSQKAIPDRLIRYGYKFKFMEVRAALEDVLGNQKI